LGPIPFEKIKVGIETKAISGDSKLTIFDPVLPALDVSSGTARGQFSVATCVGCYSTLAVPGDAVLRADAGGTRNLILSTQNSNNGAIRFTTGAAGGDIERMTILNNAGNGNVGIATATPSTKLDVNGKVRVQDLTGTPNSKLVTADLLGVLHSIAFPSDATKVLLGDGTFGSMPPPPPGSDWVLGGNSNTNSTNNILGTLTPDPIRIFAGNAYRGRIQGTTAGNALAGNVGFGNTAVSAPVINPLSQLHLGEDCPADGGYRPWMKIGVFSCWDTDNMYVGLKDEGGDRKDAVIAWGDNSDSNHPFDTLRILFAASTPTLVFRVSGLTGSRLHAFFRTGMSVSGTSIRHPAEIRSRQIGWTLRGAR
jgi:hypothetical protein